ncbi:MAG: response regulator transcription factor [Verrucomicrobia bacterium]|nr:response regulator transcription factor [Verrucomicrobiota bacterium]
MALTAQPLVSSVLIVKADRLYAEALRQLARQIFPQARIKLAASLDSAGTALATENVDVLVTGVGTSLGGDALEFISTCTCRNSRARQVLVVTTHHDLRLLGALRALSVRGVFDSTTEPPEQFLTALGAVANGDYYWSHSLLDLIHTSAARGNSLSRLLTTCEQLVFSIIGGGSDDVAAGRELGLSPATVSSVRRELHRKLGVQHRGELMRVAAQSGFVQFAPFGVVRPGYAMLAAAYQARKIKRPQLSAA